MCEHIFHSSKNNISNNLFEYFKALDFGADSQITLETLSLVRSMKLGNVELGLVHKFGSVTKHRVQ